MGELSDRFAQYRADNGPHASAVDFLVGQSLETSTDVVLSEEEMAAYVEVPAEFDERSLSCLRAFGVEPLNVFLPGERPSFAFEILPGTIAAYIEGMHPEDSADSYKAVLMAVQDLGQGRFYENWAETLGLPEEFRSHFE